MEVKNRMRNIELSTISNIRDFDGTVNIEGKTVRKNCLIRSAKLTEASDEDLRYLKENHDLSTIIDLRTFTELEELPDRSAGFEYLHIPIIRDFKDGITHENRDVMKMPDLADTYIDMVCKEEYIEGLKDVLNAILNHDYSKGSVLWHCSEGKDRCGLISVLVMMVLGVDEATIREDYLETNKTNLPKAEKIYERLMKLGNKEVADSVYKAFIADERYLNAALDHMGEDYLSRVLRLDKDKIERFRNQVLI